MLAAARVERDPPGLPPERRCLRCAGNLRPLSPRALRCDGCGWALAYDPEWGLVVPDSYDETDLARLRDILDERGR